MLIRCLKLNLKFINNKIDSYKLIILVPESHLTIKLLVCL